MAARVAVAISTECVTRCLGNTQSSPSPRCLLRLDIFWPPWLHDTDRPSVCTRPRHHTSRTDQNICLRETFIKYRVVKIYVGNITCFAIQ